MLSRALTLFIFVFCFSILCSAEKGDSLVRFNELTFHSNFEKVQFAGLRNVEKLDAIGLLMAIDSTSTDAKVDVIKKRINDKANLLKAGFNSKKDDVKRVDFLYSSTHDEFLKKYKEVIDFKEIFSTGTYNCVTGAALLALMFDQLSVPYEIKERPGHVYLYAFPKTAGIKVEVTDPIGKYIIYDKTTKENYVDYLVKSKLVTKDELNKLGADSLFNLYYFTDTTINIRQLAGDQYINAGIVHFEDKDYAGAYENWQKAYYLYPSDKHMLLLLTAAAKVVDGDLVNDSTKVRMLAMLTRSQFPTLTDDIFVQEFVQLTHKYLIEQNDVVAYEKLYNSYIDNIARDSVKDRVQYVYNYERGRVNAMQRRYSAALPFAEKAYNLRPNNLDVQTLFVQMLVEKTISAGKNNQLNDSILEVYADKYPALQANSTFGTVRGNSMLYKMLLSFQNNKVSTADKYCKMFEQLMKDNNALEVDKFILESAYLEAAKYYFKKAQYEVSKSYIRRGMKYAPDSYELKKRLSQY